MLVSTSAAVTDVWNSIVAVCGTLLGALIGGAIFHWSQRAHRREERLHQHNERLRTAYAAWAGALRRCVESERTQLIFSSEMSLIQTDKEVALQMGRDMRDVSLAAIAANTNEEMAFAKVMLTDTNRGRVGRAEGIRSMSPTDIAFRTEDLTLRLKAFEDAEPRQSIALSEFLRNIANELDPSEGASS